LKNYTSLSAIQADLTTNAIHVVDLVKGYLNRIEEQTSLNAFLEVFDQTALAKAEEVDAKLKAGNAGKLAGMVIGLKDNICYKNHKVSASSKILENFTSLYHATVVERLLAEDAVIIGRLNCDEFAMGSSNENSAFGEVKNPLDISRVPGGSSGGSAAAVAANLCLATLGSDTGGSIRQPASFCGLVGVKPTYGRVSRHGLIAYASSFDQIGPFTHTIADSALILEVIAGIDEYDGTMINQASEKFFDATVKPKKQRIAYIQECLDSEGLNPEIAQKMKQIIEGLKAEGHEVEPVSFPYLEYMVPTYYVLTTAEASSNLGRYDGIHYGYRSPESQGVDGTYTKSRSEGFGAEVKRRIMLGTFVLSAGYYDAYYTRGQKVRRIIRDKTEEILSLYDHILLPTTPDVAFKFGANADDPIKMYLEDIFTVQANLAGVPAISLPLGNSSANLPFGIQLMTGSKKEKQMFEFGEHLMKHYKD
jgi:aspartyl-tRNA(Asn)/glutamyl-tRNA(Gln) amidotransferase subunit A